ncbi:MAG: hypothetical protein HOB03_01715 [Gammaproteobacteria bacterium]|jgi:hypothetical protein|nr:hypothetical protein [Gammaproteobacteria bacterium]
MTDFKGHTVTPQQVRRSLADAMSVGVEAICAENGLPKEQLKHINATCKSANQYTQQMQEQLKQKRKQAMKGG